VRVCVFCRATVQSECSASLWPNANGITLDVHKDNHFDVNNNDMFKFAWNTFG